MNPEGQRDNWRGENSETSRNFVGNDNGGVIIVIVIIISLLMNDSARNSVVLKILEPLGFVDG